MAPQNFSSIPPRPSATALRSPTEGSLHRIATLVWLLQGAAFFAIGAAWALFPACFVPSAAGPSELCLWASPVGLDRLAIAAVQLRVPFALAFAMASLFAAMREDAEARSAYARAFFATHTVWAAVDFYRSLHTPSARWTLVDAVFLLPFLANLVFAIGLRAVKPRWRRLSGSASTLPPGLWLLWAVQGFVCVLGGLLVIFDARQVLTLAKYGPCVFDAIGRLPLCGARADVPVEVPAAAVDALRVLGGPAVGLGMLSWSAMRAEHEWLWRMYAQSATLVFSAWFVTLLVTWGGGGYAPLTGFLLCLPPLVLAVANQRLAGPPRDNFAEDLGEAPVGWILMDLFCGPMLAIQSIVSGRRATHLAGVAAKGSFTVVEPPANGPQRPRHEFFAPGRLFPAVVRYAGATWRDQAALDVRGCALRLALPGEPSPFDMGMNTGSVSAVDNLVGFALLVFSKWMPLWVMRPQLKKSWRTREVAIIGLRRAPECYSTLHFYSQTVRLWVDPDDVRWLVRYRIVPEDPSIQETGLPDARDIGALWERGRRKGEDRPTDYLSQELCVRLEGSRTLRFRFQGQFHRPSPGDETAWYNAGVEWPEDTHPWLDIGIVELDTPLEEDEAELLEFNSGNHPGSLGVPMAPSAWDYRSLADSERRIIQRLQALRRWRYGVFGLPERLARAPRKRP